MSISKGPKKNFETLKKAFANGDVALLECTDKVTGKLVNVIVAVERDGDDYVFKPFAKLFDGNPYDELDPPK